MGNDPSREQDGNDFGKADMRDRSQAQEAFDTGGEEQSPTKKHIPDSRAFRGFLQGIHEGIMSEEYRNRAYQDFSCGYNGSLRAGHFEDAVIYLMMMRLIVLEENAPDNARMLAETVAYIVQNVMLV